MLSAMMANSCKPSTGWTSGLEAAPPHQQEQARGKQPKRKQKGKGGKGKSDPIAADLSCSICGVEFDSRNQLFKHISSTGHAALKK